MSSGYDAVRKLAAQDSVDGSDCGQPALNLFLQRYALANQRANSTQTYVKWGQTRMAQLLQLARRELFPMTQKLKKARFIHGAISARRSHLQLSPAQQLTQT